MNTFADIIEALGAPLLADRMDVSYPTVASWKRRNSILPKYWPGLIAVAEEKQTPLTLQDLARIAAASESVAA